MTALFDLVGALFQIGGAVEDIRQIAKGPFRREDPAHRAKVEALSRPHAEREARIASHLGTDLDPPHILAISAPAEGVAERRAGDST